MGKTLLVGLVLQLAVVRALALTVEVGGTSIVVPPPAGHESLNEGWSGAMQLAETLTPPTNRLLAVFASRDDVAAVLEGSAPVLTRYMLLQVSRQLEGMVISRGQFTQLRDKTRKQHSAAIEQVTRNIGPFVGNAARELSSRIGEDLELSIGDSVPLGVFLDQDRAIGFAMIVRNSISAERKAMSSLVVIATALVHVKNKILFAYVFSTYEDEKDLEWARATSRRWVEEIAAMDH